MAGTIGIKAVSDALISLQTRHFFYHAAIESDIENVTLLQDIKRQQNRIRGIIGQNVFFHFR